MIIQGKPDVGLQKHQQDAYRAIQKAYEEGDRASIVMPTGCGKSFVALQLIADNKDKRILYIAPTNAIKNQMYSYIAKYVVGEEINKEKSARAIVKEHFPNLKIILYPSLLRIKDEQMEKLNADFIIMDELHRTGADKWGKRINTLLEKNSNAQILGLTATPDRMDDKNVIDELFEGKIDYELTLVDALRERIIKSPLYVKCDYALEEYLEGIRLAIENCGDEQKKIELQSKYEQMRRIVAQADGIPELLAKNIKKKDGKYIVFCKDKKHMDELIAKAEDWFKLVDAEPEIYSVFSGEGYTQRKNERTFTEFESSNSEHIKLLFSIEMLNEGLHVEDISGVIMSRPTASRIIYLQQLGRALSSDSSKDRPIVFDLVNNYLKNNLDAEVNNITNGNGGQSKNNNGEQNGENKGGTTEIDDIDIFRIQGETKIFLELLEEIQGDINISRYLINAREIKRWMQERGTTKPPSSESKDKFEKKYGKQLATIRYKLIRPYSVLQTDEEREDYRKSHPEIDEVLEIINWIDENNIPPYLAKAREIKKWMQERGTTKPPSKGTEDEIEKKYAKKLATIRCSLIKPYRKLETEEEREEFRKKHPEIDEVLEIVNWIDEKNIPVKLKQAREIKAWVQELEKPRIPSQTVKNEAEKKLGIKLVIIRQDLIRPYMALQTEEEREKFREKHPELDEVMDIVSELDIQCGTQKQRTLAELIRQDLAKRKALQEAKKLEQDYEQQLSVREDLTATKGKGEEFNEQ